MKIELKPFWMGIFSGFLLLLKLDRDKSEGELVHVKFNGLTCNYSLTGLHKPTPYKDIISSINKEKTFTENLSGKILHHWKDQNGPSLIFIVFRLVNLW